MITREELEDLLKQHEQRLADRDSILVRYSVQQALAAIGVDGSDPKDIREFQEVINHSRMWMKSTRKFETVGWMTAITVIITGALGALWLGLVQLLHR